MIPNVINGRPGTRVPIALVSTNTLITHGFTSCLEHILSSLIITNYDEAAVMSDHPTQLCNMQYYNHVRRHSHPQIPHCRVFPLSSFLFCQRSSSYEKCRHFHEQSSIKPASSTTAGFSIVSPLASPNHTSILDESLLKRRNSHQKSLY